MGALKGLKLRWAIEISSDLTEDDIDGSRGAAILADLAFLPREIDGPIKNFKILYTKPKISV